MSVKLCSFFATQANDQYIMLGSHIELLGLLILPATKEPELELRIIYF